jgi:putative ABC transport system permease protein
MAGAVIAAVLIGAIAGLYPAIRAARLAPTEALATI